MKHGKPVSLPGTSGKRTARDADGGAGKGKRKKRNGKLSITLFMESKLLWKAKWVEPKEAAF
ncbi:MAG TPA: hypothetical protein VIJ25_03470 [Methylococcales bacterium]